MDLGRGILRSELNDSSNLYNTYRHDGLPPGPIANPGKASLAAALNPASTDFFFFVADCEGGIILPKPWISIIAMWPISAKPAAKTL